VSPLALLPAKANEQHYELPAEFFELALGPHRKYSCCLYADANETLGEAEAHALGETCRHADLHDGQRVLELGCGWGSLSLWMAEHYPRSRIVSVSNSHSQRRFIEAQAAAPAQSAPTSACPRTPSPFWPMRSGSLRRAAAPMIGVASRKA